MTTVINLATGEEAVFDLEPREAVIAAYAQFERRDCNWWDYGKKFDKFITQGKHTIACGNWATILNKQ